MIPASTRRFLKPISISFHSAMSRRRAVNRSLVRSFVKRRSVDVHLSLVADVIGIVETCTAVIPFVSRTSNRDSKRRELTLVDESTSMSVTLWDEQVTRERFLESIPIDFGRFRPRISTKKSRRTKMSSPFNASEWRFTTTVKETSVSSFDLLALLEYSLSGHKNMLIKVNPDLPEAKHLRIWCDAGGRLPSTTARPATEGLRLCFSFDSLTNLIFSSLENDRTDRTRTIGSIRSTGLHHYQRHVHAYRQRSRCLHGWSLRLCDYLLNDLSLLCRVVPMRVVRVK